MYAVCRCIYVVVDRQAGDITFIIIIIIIIIIIYLLYQISFFAKEKPYEIEILLRVSISGGIKTFAKDVTD